VCLPFHHTGGNNSPATLTESPNHASVRCSAHSVADRMFQRRAEIIDARRGVSVFDALGMRGNLINNEIRTRSNAGELSLFKRGGIAEVTVDLVSGLLERVLDVLL
jgi:hypothetical protein